MQQTFQCYRCGAQNYSGTSFCWNCGIKLTADVAKSGDEHKGLKIAALITGILASLFFFVWSFSLSCVLALSKSSIDGSTENVIYIMIATIICIIGVSFVFYKPRLSSALTGLSAVIIIVTLISSIDRGSDIKTMWPIAIPVLLVISSAVTSWFAGKGTSF